MAPHRVGIIGFGFIGKVHAYGYLNLPLFYDPVPLAAKITHICTSRRETAEAGCRMIGAEKAVTDYRQITESPDIDIVHICSPNHLHKDALLSAMRHQKHIYCDKPLVATMAEAEEIRTAMADYQGTAQMTLQNRFYPATMRAKQLIDDGALGKILEYRALYLHGGSANPDAPMKWKLSSAAGGGVIADLATHVLDLVHFLLGDYESLMAATHVAFDERPSADDPSKRIPVDAEDCVMILSRMKNSALGMIEATKIASGTEDEVRLEIHGSQGALRFNGMDPHYLDFHDARAVDHPIGGLRGWNRIATGQRYPAPANGFPAPKAAMGWVRTHMACLANFLQTVAEQRPGNPGLDQGILLQHLAESVDRSAVENCWITV